MSTVNARVRAATALAACLSCSFLGCPSRRPDAKPMAGQPEKGTSSGAPDASNLPLDTATAPIVPAPRTFDLAKADRCVFSEHGRFAFFWTDGGESFAVVDVAAKEMRVFAGSPTQGSAREFGNRCGVSVRGYTPNDTSYYVPTDEGERFFSRADRTGDYVEDWAQRRSTPLPGSGFKVEADAICGGYSGASAAYLTLDGALHRTSVVQSTNRAIVSHDAAPRVVFREFLGEAAGGRLVLEAPTVGQSWSLASDDEPDSAWISLGHHRFIGTFPVPGTVDDAHLKVYDLASETLWAEVPFHHFGPFDHILVSPDGRRVVWSERVLSKTLKLRQGEDSRDHVEAHSCYLNALDLVTRRHTRWRTPTCPVMDEWPLRFEGLNVVTDGANIHGCDRALYRTYDTTSGRLLKSEAGSPIDDELEPSVRKQKIDRAYAGTMQSMMQWSQAYKLEVVAWSRGSSILALREGLLVLCTKKGAHCTEPIDTLRAREHAVATFSIDGAYLAVIRNARASVYDVKNGALLWSSAS